MNNDEPIACSVGESCPHETVPDRRNNKNNSNIMQSQDDNVANVSLHTANNNSCLEDKITSSNEGDYLQQQEEEYDPHFEDEDIQRDAANEIVAVIVHMALLFFMLLFMGVIIFSIFVVSSYGFVTFTAFGSIVFIIAITSYYCIGQVILNDKTLRPVRKKMKRWQAIATAVVVQEIQQFQIELNEHLLLTDGTSSFDQDDTTIDDTLPNQEFNGPNKSKTQTRQRTKRQGKSILFALVKPFIGKKRSKPKFPFGKRKKKEDNSYVAPSVPSDIV